MTPQQPSDATRRPQRHPTIRPLSRPNPIAAPRAAREPRGERAPRLVGDSPTGRTLPSLRGRCSEEQLPKHLRFSRLACFSQRGCSGFGQCWPSAEHEAAPRHRCSRSGVLARLRGFTGRKRYFSAIGAGYYLDIPRRYFPATVENRCSEDLPYFRASIRVPTIVLRERELAQRHENQANRHQRDVQAASVVKTFSANSLIDNERSPEKPSNPRRRVSA